MFQGSTYLVASLMAIGLMVSRMTDPNKIHAFLDVLLLKDSSSGWDPSLLIVFCSAVGTAVIGFRGIISTRGELKMTAPLLEGKFHLPGTSNIDKLLTVGMVLFGAGWGLGGLCPGPGLLGLANGQPRFFLWVSGMIVGQILCKAYQDKFAAAPAQPVQSSSTSSLRAGGAASVRCDPSQSRACIYP